MIDSPILEVKELQTQFKTDDGIVNAVNDVSFQLYRGRTLGIVGESGCGKSVTSKSVLRIIPKPGEITKGEILLRRKKNGQAEECIDLVKLDAYGKEIRQVRGGDIGMIFQEPMTALSPVHTVGDQITEAILLHQDVNKEEAWQIGIELLQKVGMPRPEVVMDNYRDQLSGGMRQRVMIAIALSCQPSILIADEPTTALDVTVEAQILELLRDLQEEMGMAIFYISHNLGVIAQVAHEVAIMYLGRIVEQGDVVSIFHAPQHPYTRLLLQAVPRLGSKSDEPLSAIKGNVPSPLNMPRGCPFHTRCPEMRPGVCDQEEPPYVQTAANHWVRCVLYETAVTANEVQENE